MWVSESVGMAVTSRGTQKKRRSEVCDEFVPKSDRHVDALVVAEARDVQGRAPGTGRLDLDAGGEGGLHPGDEALGTRSHVDAGVERTDADSLVAAELAEEVRVEEAEHRPSVLYLPADARTQQDASAEAGSGRLGLGDQRRELHPEAGQVADVVHRRDVLAHVRSFAGQDGRAVARAGCSVV